MEAASMLIRSGGKDKAPHILFSESMDSRLAQNAIKDKRSRLRWDFMMGQIILIRG